MPRLDPASLGRHLDALYRAAWALCGSREDAEDLVQDTLTRVLARPRTIREGGERAYLMQALRNTFASTLRTRSRRPRTVAEVPDAEPVDPRAIQRPDGAAEMRELFTAVAGLPEDFRLALVAVDILGLSYAEAAGALGTSEATITTRIYRARRRVVTAVSAPASTGGGGEGSTPHRRP
ncbi:MAG TPA: sigma-70 family RNA polymerase sigma factor [Solirubrobacteraceae bacterium]|nr:sigma-70 family RNA polymerase sigma factor [Solirubrobacteraceae bacterium]